jgi:putative ABC transport system permease protein
MMPLFTDAQIALRNLLQHRRRTIFLGTAIGVVTSLLLLLGGLAAGIRHTMLRAATTLSTGHLNVGGFFKVTAGETSPVLGDYRRVMEVAKRHLPAGTTLAQRGRGWAKLISDRGSIQAGLAGIDLANEPGFKDVLQIVAGRLDDLTQPNTILLFEEHLKKMDLKVGDALTISSQTSRGVANTVDVRVAAIAKNVGMLSRFSVFVPIDTLRELYQLRPDVTGAIHIHLPQEQLAHLPNIAQGLRTALAEAGFTMMEADAQAYWQKIPAMNREDWIGQRLDVSTWEDELSFITWTVKLLQGLSALLVTILIAIVITGIMNAMWIAVRERTREIGTLRAIGMQRRHVLWIFLLEAALLGLLGTLVGCVCASGLALAVNAAKIAVPLSVQLFLMSDRLRVVIEPQALIQAVFLISAVTTAAALYPAFRAARLKPINAMAHFG